MTMPWYATRAARRIFVPLALVVAASAVVEAVRTTATLKETLMHSREARRDLAIAIERAKAMRAASSAGIEAFATDYQDSTQDAQAAAELLARLRALASEQGIELSTLSPMPPREEGGARLIGVRVTCAAELRSLQALLHALESRQPLLFVERAVFRPRVLQDGSPLISADFDVVAPLRPRAFSAPMSPMIRIEPRAGGQKP
jgi:hypothetical protein